MKIAVVGSRTWQNEQVIKDYIATLPKDTVIVSGGAVGVDTIAEQSAVQSGLKTEIFKADWSQFGKSAGMIRNSDIVRNSDEVVAFWNGQSKGTKNTIDKALNAKNIKKVTVIKDG